MSDLLEYEVDGLYLLTDPKDVSHPWDNLPRNSAVYRRVNGIRAGFDGPARFSRSFRSFLEEPIDIETICRMLTMDNRTRRKGIKFRYVPYSNDSSQAAFPIQEVQPDFRNKVYEDLNDSYGKEILEYLEKLQRKQKASGNLALARKFQPMITFCKATTNNGSGLMLFRHDTIKYDL